MKIATKLFCHILLPLVDFIVTSYSATYLELPETKMGDCTGKNIHG